MTIQNDLANLKLDLRLIRRRVQGRHLCGNKGGHEFNKQIASVAGCAINRVDSITNKFERLMTTK